MAASNAPKHDFAPAWLKIPNENSQRPAGSKGTHTQERNRSQRRDENYYNRYGAEYQRGLNRQNSFEMYDASKRYSPSHTSKYRHHSVEDDYYYNYASYGYACPYPSYNDHYPMQFGSQPSLQHRDMKYPPSAPPPPPHPSRFGQMNGSYQGYYYCSNYDFFPPGEGFNNYGGGGHSNSKRSHYARDGRGESKDSKDSDRSSHDGDDKIFNDDFPSLNGTDDDGDVGAKTSKNVTSGGVWDNPPRAKFEDGNDLKNSASGLYKVVPTKGGNVRKGSRDSPRMNGSLRDMSPLSSLKSGSNRENLQQQQSMTTTQAVEIRRPKTVKTTGSQFLKTLRRENGTHNGTGDYDSQESNNNLKKGEEVDEAEDEDAEVMRNGVNDLHLDHDLDQLPNGSAKILSSSMEKELSFMRSLGWNPNDTAKTEFITDDEKAEFMKTFYPLNGRNGRTRMLQKSWSPQRMVPSVPTAPAHDVNETLSSSDTDSDDL